MSDHFRLTGTQPYATEAALIQLDRHTAADVGKAMEVTYDAYEDDTSIRGLAIEDLEMLMDLAVFRSAMSEVQAEKPYLFNDNVKHSLTEILAAMVDTFAARHHLTVPEDEVPGMAREILFDLFGVDPS